MSVRLGKWSTNNKGIGYLLLAFLFLLPSAQGTSWDPPLSSLQMWLEASLIILGVQLRDLTGRVKIRFSTASDTPGGIGGFSKSNQPGQNDLSAHWSICIATVLPMDYWQMRDLRVNADRGLWDAR